MKRTIATIMASVILATALTSVLVFNLRENNQSSTPKTEEGSSSNEATTDQGGTQLDQTTLASDKEVTKEKDNAASGTTAATTEELGQSEAITATVESLQSTNDEITASGSALGTSSGTCIYKFTYIEDPQEKPVVRETQGQANGSGIICPVVNIPLVEFSALGEWQLTLTIVSGNQKALATERVTIN